MSRIGKMPVIIPGGVTVTVLDGRVGVKGPKGELSTHVLAGTTVAVADGQVNVTAERITATILSPHQIGWPNGRLALPLASCGRNHHNGLPSLPDAATSIADFGVNGPGPIAPVAGLDTCGAHQITSSTPSPFRSRVDCNMLGGVPFRNHHGSNHANTCCQAATSHCAGKNFHDSRSAGSFTNEMMSGDSRLQFASHNGATSASREPSGFHPGCEFAE